MLKFCDLLNSLAFYTASYSVACDICLIWLGFKFVQKDCDELIFLRLILFLRFQVKKKSFFRNFSTIMLFGAVGTLISFIIISFGVYFYPFHPLFLFPCVESFIAFITLMIHPLVITSIFMIRCYWHFQENEYWEPWNWRLPWYFLLFPLCSLFSKLWLITSLLVSHLSLFISSYWSNLLCNRFCLHFTSQYKSYLPNKKTTKS